MTLAPPAPGLAHATASLPYTCGELIQGRMDGADFHITCPIAHRGSVTAAWESSCSPTAPPQPGLPWKLRAALGGITNVRFTRAPAAASGKGMAASSVDVLAALFALHQLRGLPLDPAAASRAALSIEPTDGIAFPGISLFDHRRGTLQRSLGAAPRLGIIVFEPPARVNTLAFHRSRPAPPGDDPFYRDLVATLGACLAAGDEPGLAGAATRSAQRWQSTLYNPWLTPLSRWSRRHGALGLCRAHSGTVVGILFASSRDLAVPAADLRARLGRHAGVRVWTTTLAGGGVQ